MEMYQASGKVFPGSRFTHDQDMPAVAAKPFQSLIQCAHPGGITGEGAELRQELPTDNVVDHLAVLALFPLMTLGPAAELSGKDFTQIGIQLRGFVEQFFKIPARKPPGLDLADCPDIGGARLIGENGTFTNHITGPQFGEIKDLTGTVLQLDPDRPGQNNIQLFNRSILRQNNRSRRKQTFPQTGGDVLQFIRRKSIEETDRLQCFPGNLHLWLIPGTGQRSDASLGNMRQTPYKQEMRRSHSNLVQLMSIFNIVYR